MTTNIHDATKLDGRGLAMRVKADLASQVNALHARGVVPGLATILVGDDASSRLCVDGKHKD